MKKYKCYLCQQYKLPNEFHKDKYRSSGLSSRCKKCNAELVKKIDRTDYFYQYRLENKLKLQAKWKVKYALKTGKIKRKVCEICGKKAEAHHEDYSKPLEVKWFCHKHHMGVHKQILTSPAK